MDEEVKTSAPTPAEFHVGDKVYVKSLGTISIIDRIMVSQDMNGRTTICGYYLGSDVSSVLMRARDLDFVEPGEVRRILEGRKTAGAGQ